jgi:hypothetical protein
LLVPTSRKPNELGSRELSADSTSESFDGGRCAIFEHGVEQYNGRALSFPIFVQVNGVSIGDEPMEPSGPSQEIT